MWTEPPDELTILDIPGKIAQHAYNEPAPDTWPYTLTAYLLHFLAILVGLILAINVWGFASSLQNELGLPSNYFDVIVFMGFTLAATVTTVLITIAQILLLAIRTEKNTRLTKELLYAGLRKTYPPKR